MEDIFQILFVVIFVILATVNASRKQRKEAPQTEQETLPEPWPTESCPAPRPQRVRRTEASNGGRMHPDSQEYILPNGRAEKPRKNPKAAPSVKATHTTFQSAKASQPHTEDPHPLTADFDAKKAVIWSEILKPKFEEE